MEARSPDHNHATAVLEERRSSLPLLSGDGYSCGGPHRVPRHRAITPSREC